MPLGGASIQGSGRDRPGLGEGVGGVGLVPAKAVYPVADVWEKGGSRKKCMRAW